MKIVLNLLCLDAEIIKGNRGMHIAHTQTLGMRRKS